MPAEDVDLPSTLERSPPKVRRAYAETLESALDTYEGDEERAHRAAWAAVKHIAEKKGDHWELKDDYGPAGGEDRRGGAARRGQDLRRRRREQGEGRSARGCARGGHRGQVEHDEGRARGGAAQALRARDCTGARVLIR
jgi:cation transport regulator ChaB